MPLDQVHAHLGEIHQANTTHPERFFARNVMLDRLPISQVTFDLAPDAGLQSLAYEFAIDDMTEVLAGLRARHGSPLRTSSMDPKQNEQIGYGTPEKTSSLPLNKTSQHINNL